MNYKEYQTIYEEIKQKKLHEIYIVVLEQRKQLPMREESIKELSIPFTKEKENVQSLFHSLEQNGATPEMLLHVILLQKEKELAIFTRLENGNIFDLSSRQNYVDLNQIMITDYVKASDLFQEDQALLVRRKFLFVMVLTHVSDHRKIPMNWHASTTNTSATGYVAA